MSATEGPAATIAEAERLLECAKHADWMQVVLNGGPPCFHVADEGGGDVRFCLRAKRWAGHTDKDEWPEHRFISFEQFVRDLLALVRPQEGWREIETFDTKSNDSVLVVAEGGVVGEAVYRGDSEGWWWSNNDPSDVWGSRLYPTHWMRLPDPPSVSGGAPQAGD